MATFFPDVFTAIKWQKTTRLNKYEVTTATNLLKYHAYIVRDARASASDDPDSIEWLALLRRRKTWMFFQAHENAGTPDIDKCIYNGQWLFKPSDLDIPAVEFTPDAREGESTKTYMLEVQETEGQVTNCGVCESVEEAQALVQKIASQFQGTVMRMKNGQQPRFFFFKRDNMVLDRTHADRGLSKETYKRGGRAPEGFHSIGNGSHVMWEGWKVTFAHELGKRICATISRGHLTLALDTVKDVINQNFNRLTKEQLAEGLTGKIVLAKHNMRRYKIVGVDYEKQPTDTFTAKNGPITFIEYYSQKYGLKVSDDVQPLLLARDLERRRKVTGSDGNTTEEVPIKLIPELVQFTGLGGLESSHPPERLLEQVRNISGRSAGSNEGPIASFIRLINAQGDAFQIDPSKMKGVKYFAIKRPEVSYQGVHPQARDDGLNWALRNMRLPGDSNFQREDKVLVLGISQREFTNKFQSNFDRCVPNVRISPACVFDDQFRGGGNARDWETALENNVNRIRGDGNNCAFALCYLNREIKKENDRTYSSIKAKCDFLNVPGQCFRQDTVEGRGAMSKITNIVHQIVAKRASKSGPVPLRSASDNGESKTLILGFLKRSKRFSVGVYTVNNDMNKVHASFADPAAANSNNTSETSGLLDITTAALAKYAAENNNERPEHLVIFREAVSRSDLVTNEGKAIDSMVNQDSAQPRINVYIATLATKDKTEADPGLSLPAFIINDKNDCGAGAVTGFYTAQNKPFNKNNPTRFVRVEIPYKNVAMEAMHENAMNYFISSLFSVQCALYPNWAGMVKVPAVFMHAQKAAEWVDTHLGAASNATTLNGKTDRTPCFWL